ncbi:hypothetical protein WICPIJ_010028 [Wickerhamomyces pijperi]|uniref:RRM Nup35-type domain-containing protein n=1 Tax=Wickerhamomyces pijperi TaxID=599730 RepID=A0A9P8PHY6_WICPI|nr:hypothetical protein WICPIJ_010028 [Wickerhamomyces pijperi]
MSSFQRDSNGYSKNMFGGVYEKNFDILKVTDTPTNTKFAHLKHLNTNSPDRRSSHDENSPRRTPVQKHADLFQPSNEPLTVAAINQRFHSLETQQFSQVPSSPSLNKTSLNFLGGSASDLNKQQNQQFRSTSEQPSWFNNPKKRAVPFQVIKRDLDYEEADPDSSFLLNNKARSSTGLSSSASKSTSTKTSFNMVSFGTRKSSAQDANSHITSLQDELPPLRTLNDLMDEDNSELDSHTGFHRPISSTSTVTIGSLSSTNNSSFSKPGSAGSIHSSRFSLQPPRHSQHDSEFQKQQHFSSSPDNSKYTQLPTSNNESSILVFGYPESIANQVIRHFAKFGNILEDFEAIRSDTLFFQRPQDSKKIQRSYPIYTGNGWVRLTYDNKASSVRAVEENGETFHGCLIGCVRYSKQNMDRIMKGDLDLTHFKADDDAQGNDEYLDFVNRFKNNKIVLKHDDKIFVTPNKNGDKELSKKYLEMKAQMTWLDYVNNLLFGWDDL